jgi:alkanesulfonate monooxygenase SsuD/methylene tetrahydromethanopterin reductase-like flavin-dependent oxidoreductase (luciferase family)
MANTVRVGLTLPSFVDDPEIPIGVARAADDAELDAVFVYDHIYRGSVATTRRPALECFALLGAVAAETKRVRVGSLVARATLRPAATLAHCFDAVQRVSEGRLIAGIGAGDHESRSENESYGLPFGTMADRVAALHEALHRAHGRGYPVWIGGKAAQVRELVALADGWNRWGSDVDEFARETELVCELAPDSVLSWGGVVALAGTEAAASDLAARASGPVMAGTPEQLAESLRAYVNAGATWVILGPVDSSNADNAARAGRVKELLAKE